MNYEFLCIGGNCACVHTLGEHRIKGPLDNMKSKNGLSSIKSIFEDGGLEKEFFEIGEIEQPFCGNHRDENEIWFSTRNYYIVHNNFRDTDFRNSLKNRIKTLYDYLDSLKNSSTKFLVYSLCEKDIDPINHKMSDLFLQGIEILKEQKIFEKTVFLMITSDDRKWYHFTCDDIYKHTKKVINMHILISDIETNYQKFLESLGEFI
jgi:hypothetical protein